MDHPEWLRGIALSFALASCNGPLKGELLLSLSSYI